MRPEELARRKADVQIVDVRTEAEWDAGRIEGSVHIREVDLADRLSELARDRAVVTVCRSGARSGEAATVLAGEGYDAENLEGGLLAWASAGLPLHDRDGQAGVVAEPADDEEGSELSPELQRLQDEFLGVIMAVQERFGDTEPSEEELRAFLRQRLIDQGRSPDEADEFMANLEGG